MLEIKPHEPVNMYNADSFPKNGFMEFLDMLKAWFNEIDWDQYATKDELNELALRVVAIEAKIGEIDDIKDDILFCVIQHADQSCLDHERKTSSRRK